MWSTILHTNDSRLDLPASAKTTTGNNATASPLDDSYDEEDDTATTASTGATLSTMMDQDFSMDTSQPLCLQDTPRHTRSGLVASFETSILENTKTSAASLPSRNTYFLDGGNRFISLPLLGNTNTKTAAHVSRIFEEWLQNKLYHPQDSQDVKMMDRLPILEDSVDLLAEDILNKLKSRSCVRGLTGVAKIMIKIRTGHVYLFNQLIQEDEDIGGGDGQLPVITPDMMDFFQQFPLFLDTTIYIEPKSNSHHVSSLDIDDSIPVLLRIENISTNPSDPYYLFENVSLIV